MLVCQLIIINRFWCMDSGHQRGTFLHIYTFTHRVHKLCSMVLRDLFLHTRDDLLCHERFSDARARAITLYEFLNSVYTYARIDQSPRIHISIFVSVTLSFVRSSLCSQLMLWAQILVRISLAAINKLRCPTTTAQLVDLKLLNVRGCNVFSWFTTN